MTKYVNLHCHSYGSLLDGLSKPSQIVDVAVKNGYNSAALTDHRTVSQCVNFYQACKDANIKPILGCELDLSPLRADIKDNNNRKTHHLPVLAKNQTGWRTLIQMVSRANDPDYYYYRARLDYQTLEEMLDGNIIGFSGHLGSKLSNCLFFDDNSYEGKVRPDAKKVACRWAEKLQDMFGKGNFFIEIQRIDIEHSPTARIVSDILREVSVETGIPCIATADSHYPERKDAEDQRILLCGSVRTTLKRVQNALANNEDVSLGGFFKSENFHIPSLDDMSKVNTEEEINNTQLVADMCEEYSVYSKPKKPKYPCHNELEHLKELCEGGWNDILVKRGIVRDKQKETEYRDRLNMEFGVIEKADLSGYFLVVQEFVNWSRKQGYLIGGGRGSAAGCLISYLCGITRIDPIPHDLSFSRFYNDGRNTEDRIALPDIDIDVPTEARDHIISHLKDMYGEDHVAQIGTYGRLQAKAIIREVLRAHEACSNTQINIISKCFPEESRVADQMQADKETSLIMWTLKHNPEKIKDFCYLEDNGSLGGPYATYFEQAMRMEGCHKSLGKHAAGVIIADEPIRNFIPLIKAAKGEDRVTCFEMNNSESVGGLKLDVLGNLSLDKAMYVNKELQGI